MMPLKLTLRGRPITKKNHSQIVRVHNRLMVIPSKQYKAYEADCGRQIVCKGRDINEPVNVKCVYYMPTRHRVDLCNLLEATCDILVKFHVLADDNSRIVAGHDGSRVLYDKDNPRVEIEVKTMPKYNPAECGYANLDFGIPVCTLDCKVCPAQQDESKCALESERFIVECFIKAFGEKKGGDE